MMILCGGVPDVYVERFRTRSRTERPEHYFATRPLRPDASGRYFLNDQHKDELLQTLESEVDNQTGILNDGLGVILVLRPWETIGSFADDFFPFALCAVVQMSGRPISKGREARITANQITSDILVVADKLYRTCKLMTSELQSRRRRTPILLPIRHFNSEELTNLLLEIWKNLYTQDDKAEYILGRCSEFEKKHQFLPSRKGGGFFVNDRGIQFRSPRRALHGFRRHVKEKDHKADCFYNAALRLGGGISSSVHYDCTRNGKEYSGCFLNCHDAKDYYEGKPHLNVYSNDFIR